MRSLLAAVLTATPAAAHACAVCFGKADGSGWARAFTWGLVAMIVPTFAIVFVLFGAIRRLEARREAADRELLARERAAAGGRA